MKARLISYTQPVPEIREQGIETVQDLIAYCARVSNPSNQLNKETNERLIAFLLRHKHFSPFELASACVEVDTTRDIARQVLRHRSFTFQEFSQRYADPTKDLSFETREARLQDKKNRQNSIEIDDESLQNSWDIMQRELMEKAGLTYRWAIDNGIAKEQARAVLPEGNIGSKLYIHGTIRSWIHYIELRSGNGTQKEHVLLAREIAKAIEGIFPMIDQFVYREPEPQRTPTRYEQMVSWVRKLF